MIFKGIKVEKLPKLNYSKTCVKCPLSKRPKIVLRLIINAGQKYCRMLQGEHSAEIVPSWANQLLPQLLMEQFDTLPIQCKHIDTLPIQCKHIEDMHEGVWFRKIIFDKMTAVRT